MIHRERHLREQGQQHIPKGLAIRLRAEMIARKVDCETPASRLAI